MMDSITGLWAIAGMQVLIIGLIALMLVLAYLDAQRRKQAWTELATRTGLTYESSGLLGLQSRVTGPYRGRAITLDTFTRGSGKSRTTYTRIALQANNPTHLALAIHEEGILGKLGKLVGVQDIQTGDPELDGRFIVKGRPEEAVARLLANGVLRQSLLQARSVNLEFDGPRLRFEQRGVERNVEYIQSVFDLLSTLADAVERLG